MESRTLEGLRILETIASEYEMHGRSKALAEAISHNTIVGIALTQALLRTYGRDIYAAGCVKSVRVLYPSYARKIDLTFTNLQQWQNYLPEIEVLRDPGVLGFMYDFLPRCHAKELRGFWAREMYGYLFKQRQRPTTVKQLNLF